MSKLWDMAGAEGLDVARLLFGEAVGYLSPFQSVETVLQGQDCAVLRLCDRNFRIRYAGSLHQHVIPLQRCVWVKQYPWLKSITLPNDQLPALIQQATVRAPHRLTALPNHQAVPACLDTIPILIWRHMIEHKPVVELHVSMTNIDSLKRQVSMP